MISEKGLNLIKKYEGLRLKAYKALDSEKYYTIGYGHYGADVNENEVITESEAENILLYDIKKFEKYVEQLPYEFNQNEYDALVSFVFNCGKSNLTKLTSNNTRTKKEIGEKIVLYNKANGRVLKGLVCRRNDEQNLYFTPMTNDNYYPKYHGSETRLDKVLEAIGVPLSSRGSVSRRKIIAEANGISNYKGTYSQNVKLLKLCKDGLLIKE